MLKMYILTIIQHKACQSITNCQIGNRAGTFVTFKLFPLIKRIKIQKSSSPSCTIEKNALNLHPQTTIGEMAEWSNAAVLKTVEGNTSGGSNPSLSAPRSCADAQLFIFS